MSRSLACVMIGVVSVVGCQQEAAPPVSTATPRPLQRHRLPQRGSSLKQGRPGGHRHDRHRAADGCQRQTRRPAQSTSADVKLLDAPGES